MAKPKSSSGGRVMDTSPALMFVPSPTFVWPPEEPPKEAVKKYKRPPVATVVPEAVIRGHDLILARRDWIAHLEWMSDAFAAREGVSPEQFKEATAAWDKFVDSLAKLKGMYEDPSLDLAGWWIAERPPAFEPRASSVLEGLLWQSLVLLLHQVKLAEIHDDDDEFTPISVACKRGSVDFLLGSCGGGPGEHELASMLRCEAAGVAARTKGGIRIPPSPAGHAADKGLVVSIEDAAMLQAENALPGEWDSMTADERRAWISGFRESATLPASAEAERPKRWLNAEPLKSRGEDVKEVLGYLAGKPANRVLVIDVAEAARMSVKKASFILKELKRHGLVDWPLDTRKGVVVTPEGVGYFERFGKGDTGTSA